MVATVPCSYLKSIGNLGAFQHGLYSYIWRLSVQDVEPEEDYILVIDADMIMRSPFFPKQLGVSPGVSGCLCPVGNVY